jgi:hypothetical protein
MIAENILYKLKNSARNIISQIHIWTAFRRSSVVSVTKEGKVFMGL